MISEVKFRVPTTGQIVYGWGRNGVFFNYNKETQNAGGYYSCRESFGNIWRRGNKFFGFSGSGIDLEKIDRFFNIIETNLKLEERSKFYPTNNPEAIIIEVPIFWRSNTTTRSVYTLLLRCAAAYYHRSISNALKTYRLTNQCSNALKWFLKGNTKPTYKRLDWGFADFFADYRFNPSAARYGYPIRKPIKALLVKP